MTGINLKNRKDRGFYFRIDKTYDPDHNIPQSYKYNTDELPVSFACECTDNHFARHIAEWCDKNLQGKWEKNTLGGDTFPVWGRWTFWNREDASVFRMFWGNYYAPYEGP